MNILSNILKSSLLAMVIFWTINLTETFNLDLLPFVFLSFIPIFICCTLTILITICPFYYLLTTKDCNKKKVFKNYFPFYSIIVFALCCYGIYVFGSEIFIVSFFITAYLTSAQSWVWFSKNK